MAIGRYFRGLSAYDLLGNLLPGVVLLLTVLGLSSNPPIPSKIGGIALFAAFAFVLGSIVQAYASKAVGKPQSFIKTMESAEVVPDLQYTTDSDPDDDGDDGPDDDGDDGPDDGSDESGMCFKIIWFLYPLCGPIVCWFWEPEWGEKLDDAILVNRIWMDLVDTHEIPFETDKHGVLYHLMWSKIDGTQTPSRALRMQALRNFNRGMWIALWILSLTVGLSLLLDHRYDPSEYISAGGVPIDALEFGITYVRPSYFTHWTPVWSLFLISVVGTVVFWRLFRSSEEDYIEYLFTDYAVAITENTTELRFGQDTVRVSLEDLQDGSTGGLSPESTEESGDKRVDPTERIPGTPGKTRKD